jgi:glycosyltransferase involved in cell wall biosynthesis
MARGATWTKEFKVAVIIPAHNEAPRIGDLLPNVLASTWVDELVVVCDGCSDGTADVARGMRVPVIETISNIGKAAAMQLGAEATSAEVLVFLDADLSGFRPEYIADLLRPVLEAQDGMSIGLFRGGGFLSDLGHRCFPSLSGQRAMFRTLFALLPASDNLGFGVEVALNQIARENGTPIYRVPLPGVRNSHKESKMGWVAGIQARSKMYWEIWKAWRVRRSGLRLLP